MNKISLVSLILRVGVSAMMLNRGWRKLLKIINGDWRFADPLGIGSELSLVLTTFMEFFCSILLIIGFKSRLASILLVFTMLVAAFIVHGDDPWSKQEFTLLYFVCYVAVFILHSGHYSLNARFQRK